MDDKRELITSEYVPASAPPPEYSAAHTPVYQQAYSHGNAQGQTIHSPPTQVVVVRQSQAPPKDYLLMAIIVTIFCFLPLGIVGIIKSSEAKDLYAVGDYQGAQRASVSAGKWTKAGLIIGIVWISSFVAFSVIYIAVVASAGYDPY